MIKMKNKILAIEAAPEAIPPKPNTAAIIATIKKMTVQRNIVVDFLVKNLISVVPLIPNKILCQNLISQKKSLKIYMRFFFNRLGSFSPVAFSG